MTGGDLAGLCGHAHVSYMWKSRDLIDLVVLRRHVVVLIEVRVHNRGFGHNPLTSHTYMYTHSDTDRNIKINASKQYGLTQGVRMDHIISSKSSQTGISFNFFLLFWGGLWYHRSALGIVEDSCWRELGLGSGQVEAGCDDYSDLHCNCEVEPCLRWCADQEYHCCASL